MSRYIPLRINSLLVALLPMALGCAGAPSATEIADACVQLSLTEVQKVLSGAQAGTDTSDVSTADVWSHGCAWKGPASTKLELHVHGAKTSAGREQLDVLVTVGPGGSSTTKTPVSGVGDTAIYFKGDAATGLSARKGDYAVSLTTYLLTPAPTAEQLGEPVRRVFSSVAPPSK